MVSKDKPHWDEWEERVASLLNGSVVRGSGRSDQHKGDVITDKYLVECKSTQSPSYTVKEELLRKISLEAIGRHRDPLFCVRTSCGEFCLIPMMALPDWFDTSKQMQIAVYGSIAVGKSLRDGIYLFDSGRRMYVCDMQTALEVLGFAEE